VSNPANPNYAVCGVTVPDGSFSQADEPSKPCTCVTGPMAADVI
jgi:hypothetical protein